MHTNPITPTAVVEAALDTLSEADVKTIYEALELKLDDLWRERFDEEDRDVVRTFQLYNAAAVVLARAPEG